MHPFWSRTRASITFSPTMKWRPSKGFRASTATELHGMWRNSALSGLLFRMVPLSATLLAGRALFGVFVFLAADVVRLVVFNFFFFIGIISMNDTTSLYTGRRRQ